MADAMDGLPPPGTLLAGGAYRLERLVGHGGMGAVYAATQVKLRRTVAVKLLVAGDGDGPEARTLARRLGDEATAAARVRHEALVEVLAVGEDPRFGPYVVFEFLAGGSLRDELGRSKALGWPEALRRIAHPLLQGLAALHAAGVVHRDVKPENLLAGPGGRYKLGDLGLALFEGRSAHTATGMLVGTPGYLAPEQVAARGPTGPAADLYAAAVTLVEAATGSLPFAAKNLLELLSEQSLRDVSPRELTGLGLPPAVAAALARALARDPASRPAGAAALLAELEAAGAEATAGPAATLQIRAAPPAPCAPATARRPIGPAAAVLALLAGSFVLLSLPRPRPSEPAPTLLATGPLDRSGDLGVRLAEARRQLRGGVRRDLERLRASTTRAGAVENRGVAQWFASLWATAAEALDAPGTPEHRPRRLAGLQAMTLLLRWRPTLPARAAELAAPPPEARGHFWADGANLPRQAALLLVALAEEARDLDGPGQTALLEAGAELAERARRDPEASRALDEAWPALRGALGDRSPLWLALDALRSPEADEELRGLAAALEALRAQLLAEPALPTPQRLEGEPRMVRFLVERAIAREAPQLQELTDASVAASLDFLRETARRGLPAPWVAALRVRLAMATVAAQAELAAPRRRSADEATGGEVALEALRDAGEPLAAAAAAPALPPAARASLRADYEELGEAVRRLAEVVPAAPPPEAELARAFTAIRTTARTNRAAYAALDREFTVTGRSLEGDLRSAFFRLDKQAGLGQRRVLALRKAYWPELAASLGGEAANEFRAALSKAANELADPRLQVLIQPLRGSVGFSCAVLLREQALQLQLLATDLSAPGDVPTTGSEELEHAFLVAGINFVNDLRKQLRSPETREAERPGLLRIDTMPATTGTTSVLRSLEPLLTSSATAPLVVRTVWLRWACIMGRDGDEVAPVALDVLRDLPALRDRAPRPPSTTRLLVVDYVTELAHEALSEVKRPLDGEPAAREMNRWLQGPGSGVATPALRGHDAVRRAELARRAAPDGGLRDEALRGELEALLADKSFAFLHRRARLVLTGEGFTKPPR